MEQRIERMPGFRRIGRLLDGSQDRRVPRPGLRLRTATQFASWSMWGLSTTLTALSLLLLALNLSYPDIHIFDFWVENTMIAIGCSVVGALIASRCPRHPIGWIFCVIGLTGAVRHFGAQYAGYALLAAPGSLPAGEAVAWITSWTWVLYMGLFIFLALLFPNGRLPSSRWRWVAWLSAIVIATGAVSVAFSPGPLRGLGPIHNPLGVEGIESIESLFQAFLFVLGLFAAASLFLQLRNTRGVERQQLKWFTYATAVLIGAAIPRFTISISMGVPWLWWAGFVLVIAGLGGIPIATGIAILKYRLYDIDVIINRTLVYVALSASVVGIYMLIVGGLGALLQTSGNVTISLFATALVAVLFHPLRSRLQGGVNELMYGERDEPYKVLSRLGRRLEATLAPEAALKTIVETVAQALKLPYAAIALKQNDGFVTAAEYGTSPGESVALPLVYRTEPVGRLIVAPRASGETFTPSDWRLLDDLARQAGAAVHAVGLTVDLQRSRERLVTAREEERRRLRRDLHDGLGPTLAGLTYGLDATRNMLAGGPDGAETLLAHLKDQTQAAVSDVRRLVYGLRPPALDDLGLIPAIREQAANHGFLAEDCPEKGASRQDGPAFCIKAPEHLPPLPAAVEVACYRIAQEALTNVARHARASACRIRLGLDGNALELEVADDGVGIPEARRAGVGTTSMRERAAELGGTCAVTPAPAGGTRVLARLPLPAQ